MWCKSHDGRGMWWIRPRFEIVIREQTCCSCAVVRGGAAGLGWLGDRPRRYSNMISNHWREKCQLGRTVMNVTWHIYSYRERWERAPLFLRASFDEWVEYFIGSDRYNRLEIDLQTRLGRIYKNSRLILLVGQSKSYRKEIRLLGVFFFFFVFLEELGICERKSSPNWFFFFLIVMIKFLSLIKF